LHSIPLNKRRTPFGPEADKQKEGSYSDETFFAEKLRSSLPASFVDLDRQTPMFLPYDLREWSGL
jgi:hypothetical protein